MFTAIWLWFTAGVIVVMINGPSIWAILFVLPFLIAHFFEGFLLLPLYGLFWVIELRKRSD